MSHYMPPSLLALFAPRQPVLFKEAPEKRSNRPLEGVAQYLACFTHSSLQVPPEPQETREERRQKAKLRAQEANLRHIEAQLDSWDPKSAIDFGDAMKTLFVGRLAYNATEVELRHEFEHYGPVKKICIVKDTITGKPRGYAFVEFEHSSDLKDAYRSSDGRKLCGRRIVVDVERGRTVKNWKPRRLGGGLGGSRIGGKNQNVVVVGRDASLNSSASSSAAPRENRDERRHERGTISGPVMHRERERERDREPDRERDRDHYRRRSASPRRDSKSSDRDRDRDRDDRRRY